MCRHRKHTRKYESRDRNSVKTWIAKTGFTWSCVVNDQVALGLVNYIHFGLSCGVRHFTLSNLTKYPDIEGATNVQYVTTLSDKELNSLQDWQEQRRLLGFAPARRRADPAQCSTCDGSKTGPRDISRHRAPAAVLRTICRTNFDANETDKTPQYQ